MADKKKPKAEKAAAEAGTEPVAATPETQAAEEQPAEPVAAEPEAAVPEAQTAEEQPAEAVAAEEAGPVEDAAPAEEAVVEQAAPVEETAAADEPVAEEAAPAEEAPVAEETAPADEPAAEQAAPAEEAAKAASADEAPVTEEAAATEQGPVADAAPAESAPAPAAAPAHAPREQRGRGPRGGGGGGRDGGRDRGRGRGGRDNRGGRDDDGGEEFVEKLVHINRVSKTVKGGKRFGFAALMVVGDGKGRVGFGHGKAREVPEAIQKATAAAKKGMVRVPLREGRTLHHDGTGNYGAGRVHVRSAPPGTGIIAGGPMRAVFESLGVADVVTKSIGTSNPYNMIRATFAALDDQTSPKSVAARRGKKIADLMARRAGAAAEDASVEAEAVAEQAA